MSCVPGSDRPGSDIIVPGGSFGDLGPSTVCVSLGGGVGGSGIVLRIGFGGVLFVGFFLLDTSDSINLEDKGDKALND